MARQCVAVVDANYIPRGTVDFGVPAVYYDRLKRFVVPLLSLVRLLNHHVSSIREHAYGNVSSVPALSLLAYMLMIHNQV